MKTHSVPVTLIGDHGTIWPNPPRWIIRCMRPFIIAEVMEYTLDRATLKIWPFSAYQSMSPDHLQNQMKAFCSFYADHVYSKIRHIPDQINIVCDQSYRPPEYLVVTNKKRLWDGVLTTKDPIAIGKLVPQGNDITKSILAEWVCLDEQCPSPPPMEVRTAASEYLKKEWKTI